MCKLMNCHPSFVVHALKHYRTGFEEAVSKYAEQRERKFSADELQKALLRTIARMMCSHHAMTETVAKVVRLYLLSEPQASADQANCVALGGVCLSPLLRDHIMDALQRHVADQPDGLVALLDSVESRQQRQKLTARQARLQQALQRVEAAYRRA